MVILMFFCFLYVGFMVFVMLLGDSYIVLCFVIFFCGLGIGIIWFFIFIVMSEMFYILNFGRNWGIVLLFVVLLGMVGQYFFGVFYDEQKLENELFCYGLYCVVGGLGVCVGFFVFVVVFGIILMFYWGIRLFCQ